MRTGVPILLLALLIVSSTPALARAQQATAALGPREQPSAEFRRASTPAVKGQVGAGMAVRDSTAARMGNRRLHAVIGAGIGFATGFIIGKSVDGGRSGCNREASGQNCDWLSGYEEIIGGLVGAAIGGVIGALLPHT